MNPILIMCVSFFMSWSLQAQDIAAFSGTKTPSTVTVPHINAEALSRGPALTVAGGNTFNSGNWATGGTLDINSYIEWSVTADPNYIINITKLQINVDRDPDGFSNFFAGNGPAKIKIRTSLDNFTVDIYSNDKVSNSGLSPIIETTLQSVPGGSIVFRLYGFSSTIGLLGPLGTLDIEGGLGTVLGLTETGIRLMGKVTYDGLLYSGGRWTPKAPNANTSHENVFIENGTYSEANRIQVKNLKVAEGAGIVIQKTGAITVNGNLTTANNVILKSDDNSFASLIVTDTVTGTAAYQRHVSMPSTIGETGNNLLVSAPVTGEAFKDFHLANASIEINKAKNLILFGPLNKIKGSYSSYPTTETTSLTPATGYKAAIIKDGKLTFSGMVNTKAVHKTIHKSGSTLAEWNLIGNPYPSYLKMSEFLAANTTQFDPELTGLYSFNGDPSNGLTIYNLAYLSIYPNAKIAPGQGFLVASKTDGGSVTFMPEMRSVGNSRTFGFSEDEVQKNIGFLKLNLSNGISKYSTDFYFNSHSTKGLDPGYDAGFYDKVPDFAIYSHLVENNAETAMAVQSLPYADLSKHTRITLGINAKEGQQLTISIAELILPEETKVYLEDQLTNTFTLLNKMDYTYYNNSNIDGTGRFFLHITNSTLSFGSDLHNIPQLFTSNNAHSLHIEGAVEPHTEISIFDLQGRRVLHKHLQGQSENQQIDLSFINSGLYLVKLKNSAHEKIRKIFIE